MQNGIARNSSQTSQTERSRSTSDKHQQPRDGMQPPIERGMLQSEKRHAQFGCPSSEKGHLAGGRALD
jgi:hypothetical protein